MIRVFLPKAHDLGATEAMMRLGAGDFSQTVRVAEATVKSITLLLGGSILPIRTVRVAEGTPVG